MVVVGLPCVGLRSRTVDLPLFRLVADNIWNDPFVVTVVHL